MAVHRPHAHPAEPRPRFVADPTSCFPPLCIRFPKDKNPLTFDWKGKETPIRCMLMGEINEGRGISILLDVGEAMGDGKDFGVPIYTYRNFRRQEGLTVEEAVGELGSNELAELGVQIPEELITDCVRLCCSLCLLEHDPSVIEPDVLSKDRTKFEQTGDEKFVSKAHRRGKVGWNVGLQVEVAPHYRRPHMALVWTGRGREVPRVVPRRGSVVHPGGGGEVAEWVWRRIDEHYDHNNSNLPHPSPPHQQICDPHTDGSPMATA